MKISKIWAGFRPVSKTEKKFGPSKSKFRERVFQAKKKFKFSFKYCSVRTKKNEDKKNCQPKYST